MATKNQSKNLGALSNKIYDLLNGLESDDRARVLNSVTQLYGDSPLTGLTDASSNAASGKGPDQHRQIQDQQIDGMNAQQFFVHKDPQNKGERLAVVARYRELHGAGTSHQLNDFASVFNQARQNFDKNHFSRDMKNAQNQAGLFNKGTARGQYQLSYFGQEYVDALPDRAALKNLRRPTRKTASKKAAKKGARK